MFFFSNNPEYFEIQEDPYDVLTQAFQVDEDKIMTVYLHDVKVFM